MARHAISPVRTNDNFGLFMVFNFLFLFWPLLISRFEGVISGLSLFPSETLARCYKKNVAFAKRLGEISELRDAERNAAV
jgi:hypothetical protein